jgi:hypothetical protein
MTAENELVTGNLVEVASTLRQVIEAAGATERDNVGLASEVSEVVADVAVASYKAGMAAVLLASKYYPSPEVAVERLSFQADLALLDLGDPTRLTTHSQEVTRLIDEVPSCLPVDDRCLPPGGFTEHHRKAWESISEDLIANFKLCDDVAWSAVAGELAFRYGRFIEVQGVRDEDLANRVLAFAIKQQIIIRYAVDTGLIRQPGQDDHSYDHYLGDLSVAAMPVWKALSAH